MKKYTVEIFIPNASMSYDDDIYVAAGNYPSYSGCDLSTGGRTHAWENLSQDDVDLMMSRLEDCVFKLGKDNGIDDLGATIMMTVQ